MHNLARTLAAELGREESGSTRISPGYIETPMFHEHIPPQAHPAVVAAVPSARLGTARDVADAVAFLASDDGVLCATARI